MQSLFLSSAVAMHEPNTNQGEAGDPVLFLSSRLLITEDESFAMPLLLLDINKLSPGYPIGS